MNLKKKKKNTEEYRLSEYKKTRENFEFKKKKKERMLTGITVCM